MIDVGPLQNASVLITGGSGFIGGRLAEYLALGLGARVKVLSNHFGRAVYTARLPVELVPGDLLDPASLQRAMAGCQYVFHCAYRASGEDAERRSITVDGTANLLAATAGLNVQRFVHLSTISVLGPDPGPQADENTPLTYRGDVYADSKIDAEKAVLDFGRSSGLPVTVLRPTIVYGPRSMPWTVGPVLQLKAGALRLIKAGTGLANYVYIDDVVQAMLLAAVRPEAVGEVFTVSHGAAVTWREFYSYYAEMLGQADIPELDIERATAQAREQKSVQGNPALMLLSFVGSEHARSVMRQVPGVRSAYRLVTSAMPGSLKHNLLERAEKVRQLKLAPPPELPAQQSVQFFSAKNVFPIAKAQRLLGYEPKTSLARGMALTEGWLRYVRLVTER